MRKLISLLLCLSLCLGLGVLPALAAEEPEPEAPVVGETEESLPEGPAETPEEPAPVPDGRSAANVFYYSYTPGFEGKPMPMAVEAVAVGGHPAKIPTWSGMDFTWSLSADASAQTVDPASYTIQSEDDTLTFYGYLDSVHITLHLPADSGSNAFGECDINRGGTYDASKQVKLPRGYWAAGWADADGNLLDTENTPIWEDTDLYALEGNFRVTYMVGKQQIGGEGFFDPGTPKHAPTSYLQVTFDDSGLVQHRYPITGWTDENGQAVDISTVTIASDRTLYAVLDADEIVPPETEWGFDWSFDREYATLTVGGAEILAPPEPTMEENQFWIAPWMGKVAVNTFRIHVEEGVREIQDSFFRDLSMTEEIRFPSTIERVAHDAFPVFRRLTTITVAAPEGYEFLGWVDEEGEFFTNDDILAGAEYTGDLFASFVPVWTEGRFTDVAETAWYHDAVKFCYQAELMNGLSDTVFSPGGTATRGQVVTVLWRLAGEPVVEDESWYDAFSDVSDRAYYSDAVAWAAAYEITTGYSDGSFRPEKPVTRQEFLTFLYRFTATWAGEQPPACDRDTLREFADYADVASWAEQPECWSVNAGLQTGAKNSDGTCSLNPAQSIKRSELAAFLMRYCAALSL